MKIGLTGGIASGKSTIVEILESKKVPVIQADKISAKILHSLTIRDELIELFGEKIVQNDGNVDKKWLRELIFNKPEQREKLEALLHPKIKAVIADKSNQYQHVIIEAPLLIEANWQDQFDAIWVIKAPIESRMNRLLQRENMHSKLAKKIISSQTNDATHSLFADAVIDNSGNIRELKQQVFYLLEKYKII